MIDDGMKKQVKIKRKIIYDLLLEFCGKMCLLGKLKSNENVYLLRKFHPKYKFYEQYFDDALSWWSSEEGYRFWAYIQLNFSYCLYCAKLIDISELTRYYRRVKRYFRDFPENEELLDKRCKYLLMLCEREFEQCV